MSHLLGQSNPACFLFDWGVEGGRKGWGEGVGGRGGGEGVEGKGWGEGVGGGVEGKGWGEGWRGRGGGRDGGEGVGGGMEGKGCGCLSNRPPKEVTKPFEGPEGKQLAEARQISDRGGLVTNLCSLSVLENAAGARGQLAGWSLP